MLTHNALADMYGPSFLLLYASVIALTLAYCGWSVSRLDTTSDERLPLVPARTDPFEIAFLRGGENEVTRVAVFALIQRGYLERRADKPGKKNSPQRLTQTDQPPDVAALSPLEREVFEAFRNPRLPGEIFRSGLPARVKRCCAEYEQALRAEQLLSEGTDQAGRTSIGLIGAGVILGLGGYKLLAALANGHSNVGFLILLALASSFALVSLCKPRRLTRRGRAYLQRLQQAFMRLKRSNRGQSGNEDPSVLLLSVYGVSALAGTPHAYYSQMFTQSSASGGCGSSSGGCGSGSGGSCGGGGGCGGCGGGS